MQRIITLFFVLISFTLHAQYERGNWYLSGSTVIEDGSQSTVVDGDFQPEAASRSGYFLFDRLLVGLNPLAPSAFVRYYQPLKPQGKLAAFAELNVASGFLRRNTVTFQPSIGLEYQLSPELLLSARLQHSFDGKRQRSTSLQFGFNTVIGRRGLEPGQNLLRKGALFIDPNIGQITLGNYNLSNGGINWLGVDLHLGGGLMLTDRISLDGSISASNYASESDFSTVTLQHTTTLAADLGLRYYLTGKGRLRPYVGAGLSARYDFRTIKYETAGRPDEKVSSFGINPYLKLGALFFLNEKVALDASLETNFLNSSNVDVFTSPLGLGMGVKIFLDRSKKQ